MTMHHKNLKATDQKQSILLKIVKDKVCTGKSLSSAKKILILLSFKVFLQLQFTKLTSKKEKYLFVFLL